MNFGGIQRTSTIDFPGVLACVIFCAGCDMNCFYCHNRSLIPFVEKMPAREVHAFLDKRAGKLDGVVVSGGEPTLQPDLLEFLQFCRELGYQIKLDTNGQRPGTIGQALENALADYVAVDLKALRPAYLAVCGIPPEQVHAEETIRLLLKAGAAFEVRTTLYPGMTLEELQALLRSQPPVPRWRLNDFQMPADADTADARFRRPRLTRRGLAPQWAALRKLQPGLV